MVGWPDLPSFIVFAQLPRNTPTSENADRNSVRGRRPGKYFGIQPSRFILISQRRYTTHRPNVAAMPPIRNTDE